MSEPNVAKPHDAHSRAGFYKGCLERAVNGARRLVASPGVAPSGPGKQWVLLSILALGCAAFIVAVYHPGLMTRDSLVQLKQGRDFAFSDDHPPILALIWRYVDKIYPGPLGMLLLMNALYWGGLCVFFRYVRLPLRVRLLGLPVVGLFPPMLLVMGVIWKDTLMQGALMAGFGACLAYLATGRRWLLALIGLFLLLGIAARHNAAAAALPLLILPFEDWRRLGPFRPLSRLALASLLSLVSVVVLQRAVALTTAHFATKTEYWQTVPIFDLAGMSVQLGEVLIQPESGVLNSGKGLSDIRAAYHPTNHLALYKCRRKRCRPTFVRVADPEHLAALKRNWLAAIKQHPGAYLRHRLSVFEPLLGIDNGPATYIDVPKNELGVRYEPSALSLAVTKLLVELSGTLLFKVWLYVILEALAAVVGLYLYWTRSALLCLSSSLSGLLYLATFFLATGSPDFRYAVWTILTLLLAGVAAAAEFRSPRQPTHRAASSLELLVGRDATVEHGRDLETHDL